METVKSMERVIRTAQMEDVVADENRTLEEWKELLEESHFCEDLYCDMFQ